MIYKCNQCGARVGRLPEQFVCWSGGVTTATATPGPHDGAKSPMKPPVYEIVTDRGCRARKRRKRAPVSDPFTPGP